MTLAGVFQLHEFFVIVRLTCKAGVRELAVFMRPREPPSRDLTIEHDRSAMADCIPMTTRSELAGVRARIEPRGLSRIEAAIYVGVSPSLFDEMVRDGIMPKPKRINSRTVWDRKRLDEAFEALPDDGDSDGNPWDQVAA